MLVGNVLTLCYCFHRTATLLNLFGEKVDQVVITGSLAAALGNWQGVTLKHYSVTESTMVSAARANTDGKVDM